MKALRVLQVEDWLANFGLGNQRDTLIEEVFSTIASPVFSELVIVLVGNAPAYLPQEVALFETLGRMNKVRPFRLAFLFEGLYPGLGEAQSVLAKGLEYVTAKGLLDFLNSPPTIYIT